MAELAYPEYRDFFEEFFDDEDSEEEVEFDFEGFRNEEIPQDDLQFNHDFQLRWRDGTTIPGARHFQFTGL